MNKITFINLIVFLAACKTVAQNIPTYYITQKYDTIQIKMEVTILEDIRGQRGINFAELHKRIWYYETDHKKRTIRPKHAVEFGFSNENEKFRFVKVYNNLELDTMFLRLKTDGPVRMYCRYYVRSVGNSVSPLGNATPHIPPSYINLKETYLLQKGNGRLFQPDEFQFKKDMANFFSDYPELVTRILNGEFDRESIPYIVESYNTWKNKGL